jgi:chromosome segregation ATPase
MADMQPYRRSEFAGALAANAAAKPFNIGVLIATMAAAVAVGGTIGLALAVALLVYAAACVRTFFDGDEADKVLARERRDRRGRLAASSGQRLKLDELAPPIREHVRAARRREATIREAIERSELPYDEVSAEVDGFVRAMEGTAARAETLYEALADNPPEHVEMRLAQVRAEPGREALVEALEHQARVQRRMEAQLQRFYDEMERMTVELDTIRGSLVSLSATEGAQSQERLAGDVRSLRERMGTVADSMAEVYEPGG